ncbi:LSU ribosomal protein L24p (L26e) [hydrothermal vent metagenome]|uniref:LSU ribosomal protein L24p (L26e) n=1 Tax=hydrothermal vent metagenome TaxID=652676 RepID=A0A3B1E139_9ZZZZ
MKIRRGDSVVVVTGNDSGSTPHRVVQVIDGGNKLMVEGINRVLKHVRRGHPKSPQGGRLQLELPIHSSNVQFYCSTCDKGTRLGYQYAADGSKQRFCRKCKTVVDTISPPRPRYAKS